jgi:hypothetical protein
MWLLALSLVLLPIIIPACSKVKAETQPISSPAELTAPTGFPSVAPQYPIKNLKGKAAAESREGQMSYTEINYIYYYIENENSVAASTANYTRQYSAKAELPEYNERTLK